MKIGVDIDGVVLNFERDLKVHAELFNFIELKRRDETKREEHFVQKRHNWSDEEKAQFVEKYFISLSKITPFMPGAVEVLKMLKNEGHKLVIISARGGIVKEMKDVALERFNEVGLVFDDYFWGQGDKLQTAKDIKLDVMIDDSTEHCKTISAAGVKTIYFRDVDRPILQENEFLFDATNWGEVYKIINTKI